VEVSVKGKYPALENEKNGGLKRSEYSVHNLVPT
jgi:hypothetical protein